MAEIKPFERRPVWGTWLAFAASVAGWLCGVLFLIFDEESNTGSHDWLIGVCGAALFLSGLANIIFWRHWIELLHRASKQRPDAARSADDPERWPYRLSPFAYRKLLLGMGVSHLLIGTLFMCIGF